MAITLDGTNGITTPDINSTTYGGTFSEDGTYLRLASGTGGIQFGGDTAAANALDDYEEGTWTPVITSQGGTIGSTTFTNGIYTKVGRIVTVSGNVKITSVGTGSGALRFTLPFASASNDFAGSGAERTVAGYQCAVFGEVGGIDIRKYDFTTVIVLNHEIKFSASYVVA